MRRTLNLFFMTLKRTVGYMSPRKTGYYVGMLCVCSADFLSAYLLAKFFSKLVIEIQYGLQRIVIMSLIMFISYSIVQVMRMTGFYYMNRAFVQGNLNMKLDTQHHALNMIFHLYEKLAKETVFTTIQTDVERTLNVAGSSLQALLTTLITGVGSLIVIVLASPEIAGLTVLFGVLGLVVNIRLVKRVKSLEEDIMANEEKQQSEFHSQFSAKDFIEAFGISENVMIKQQNNIDEQASLQKDLAKIRACQEMLKVINSLVFYVGIIALGLFLTRIYRTDLSDVIFCLGMSGQVSLFFASIGIVITNMQNALVGSERLWEFLDLPQEEKCKGEDLLMSKPDRDEINISDLSFAYPEGNQTILSHINVAAKSGDIIALVGSSGSGKSTLTKLLLRLYDNYSGSIKYNGYEIANIKLSLWRGKIGYVDQDVSLLPCKVEENIFPEEHADEKVRYQSVLVDRLALTGTIGRVRPSIKPQTDISGGEQQRVHILRALLSKKEILILDEPTSQQDVHTEKLVIDEILRYANKGKIIIYITHSQYLAGKAKRVWYMDSGSIRLSGLHNDLLKNEEEYRQFWQKIESDCEG